MLSLTAVSLFNQAHAYDNKLTMMWWNVENLFDTVDDPLTRDSEFTPEGKKRWTEKKLLLKCMRISHIVKVAALKTGGYPEILAFAEVENLNVFKKLLSFLPDNSYKTAYHAANDPRGIDI
ncbi:MAG: endonuclease, partial [Chlorobium sp.]|nr:endonuclease [Chlorobium sp.]